MEITFTKMHGLGNDFVLLDAMSAPISVTAEQIKQIADRRFGIGCDQVLLIERPQEDTLKDIQGDQADIHYRIFNADGLEVEQCGNGSRCVAKYLKERRFPEREVIVAETEKGVIKLYLEADGLVKVDMGPPILVPSEIPLLREAQALRYDLTLGSDKLQFCAVSMGNPHAVLNIDDVQRAPVASLGSKLGVHPVFPEGVNVGFMEVLDRHRVRLRVYERGVGETLACGSGACAAVVAGRLMSLLDPVVDVELPGGHLQIQWQGDGAPVWMSGPAATVFEGRITL